MQTGVNIAVTESIAKAVNVPIIASGGVAGLADIDNLLKIENAGIMSVIVGKALYGK